MHRSRPNSALPSCAGPSLIRTSIFGCRSESSQWWTGKLPICKPVYVSHWDGSTFTSAESSLLESYLALVPEYRFSIARREHGVLNVRRTANYWNETSERDLTTIEWIYLSNIEQFEEILVNTVFDLTERQHQRLRQTLLPFEIE